MPILTDKDNDLYFDYEIPDDIRSAITLEFSKVFFEQLNKIFNSDNYMEQYKWFFQEVFYFEGTHGWNTAIKNTSQIVGCPQIYDYYCTLDWYDSDLFDDKLFDIVCDFIRAQHLT